MATDDSIDLCEVRVRLVGHSKLRRGSKKGIADPQDPDSDLLLCERCDRVAVSMCAQCQDACYCSRRCQDMAWREGHAQECGYAVRSLPEEDMADAEPEPAHTETECLICWMEPGDEDATMSCGHVGCQRCLEQMEMAAVETPCPCCRRSQVPSSKTLFGDACLYEWRSELFPEGPQQRCMLHLSEELWDLWETCVEYEYNKALELIATAAQKHKKAQYSLGWCYQHGKFVDQDSSKALGLWEDAATQGDPQALFNLGCCFFQGSGCEVDAAKAVRLWEDAAELGHVNSLCNLAVCYEQGSGVKQDLEQAIKYHHGAAAEGNQQANFNLGLCYEQGRGVAKDLDKAMEFYQTAAAGGDADAKAKLVTLGAQPA
eukprot:TRINITY_DN1405_c0_g1_i1.p1 TRINITY_DN1405_c0_g1~~TRINITY_DN1405_c0_g1_i1.p1  ORF type:complete len:373 (+),score=83.13 TRINITY_DN1405_c0_g1_i1:228-1346(+)